ncbi:TPA: endonuclease MutS2 [Candidatus Bipolaricaulota bacterium]|nr:endonuclease MutS2 [Candidatus Bipolaricaulota bacterium]
MSVLNPRTRRDIELNQVLGIVAGYAASELGKQAVLSFSPTADRAEIEREFALVEEMLEAVRGGFSPGAISDLRPILDQAKAHGDLSGEQLLTVAETLEAAGELQLALSGERTPRLAALVKKLSDQGRLAAAIRRAIDERGEIRDDASPKLRALTRHRRILADEITAALKQFINRHRELVQEPVVTQRGGRLVVPLKSGAQGTLRVVVHDSSASGQTLFCEPTSLVHANNRLRELADDIWRERLRILTELVEQILAAERRLRADMEVLEEIDSLYARARFALAWRATIPRLTEEERVELVEARHPLLGARAVPITIHFGGPKKVVVITGPNTGGKTVTLKTIGLFCALAQCGVPIPASSHTTLGVFARIRSDIGEEQSIEQNLSTFSSHMTNIVGILAEADERTLVLLDELGAGTDPQEGAALGLAILEYLLELGCTAAVATHLTPLKHFAIKHPEVLSCSMEFDLDTLSPTYRVLEGVPGRSCALIIAERLGLPKELVERAKGSFSLGEIRAEEIIEELQRERAAARRLRANLDAEREVVRRLKADYQRRLAALKEKKAEAISRELARLEEELRAARKELAELIAQARAQETAAARRAALKRVEELARRLPGPPGEERPAPHLREGDMVRIRASGAVGRVLRVDGARVEVEVKGKRVELSPGALEPAPALPPVPPVRPDLPVHTSVPLELSVRGLTVEEAKRRVDAWLDRLLLSGVHSGRLIHGKGTGTLRKALHEHLASLPYVRRFYLAPPGEGGEGVTIVEL